MLVLMITSFIILGISLFSISLIEFAIYLHKFDCFSYSTPAPFFISLIVHFCLLGIIVAIGHFIFLTD
jgi:hypothetical protein